MLLAILKTSIISPRIATRYNFDTF